MHTMSPTTRRWANAAVITVVLTLALSLLSTGYPATAAGIATAASAVAAFLLDRTVAHAATAARSISQLQQALTDALRDPVTGLAVRLVAERHLSSAVGVELTVAVIDVDGMHELNTVYSHAGGDTYLAGIADRLRQAAAPDDVIARLGGDEFVLISRRPAHTVARAIAAATTQPVTIGTATVPVRASTGLCYLPGGDPHTALGRADLAMYTAKRRGSRIEHYDPVRDGTPLPAGIRPAIRQRQRRRCERR